MHETSEGYYLVLQGELRLWIASTNVSLRANELLMVQPRVPHAVVGGAGLMEHFVFRAPALADRQALGLPPRDPPPLEDDLREPRRFWGYRTSLLDSANCNCWLVGNGEARFPSYHLSLAWLDMPTEEQANAGLGTRHRLRVPIVDDKVKC